MIGPQDQVYGGLAIGHCKIVAKLLGSLSPSNRKLNFINFIGRHESNIRASKREKLQNNAYYKVEIRGYKLSIIGEVACCYT